MGKKQLLQAFKKFCKSLSEKDRVAIVHHSDADGFCSALIAAKAVEKLTGKRPVVVQAYEYRNTKLCRKVIALMKGEKANTLIVLDVAIDCEQGGILESPFEKCLVVDHHRMCRDLNSKKILFLKAQFFTRSDSSSYVTSKFAFDLFSKVAGIDELDWIACVGILGDMNLKTWKSFVRNTIKRRKTSLTDLYRFLNLIAAVEVMAAGKMAKLFWLFYDAKKPLEILESRFKKYLERFKKEKDSLVAGFDKKAEHFPEIELYFYAIKAGHRNIKSYVANELSEMHPNETIILIQNLEGGKARFSARRPDFKVKVNDLLRQAVKGLQKASAGGHAPAAAGSLPRHQLKKFKENVVRILRKEYGKKAN